MIDVDRLRAVVPACGSHANSSGLAPPFNTGHSAGEGDRTRASRSPFSL